MELNIVPKTVMGMELYQAVIVWRGTTTTTTHASWDGAYRWLARKAKYMANEYRTTSAQAQNWGHI